MSGLISIISMVVGTAGIFFGFYFDSTQPLFALRIVVLSTVGIVGVLSFIRHVVFYKSDMKRLEWVTEKPDWMFEVGFANLAFGAMGLIAFFTGVSRSALILVLAGYAIYLLQAAILHGYRYFTDEVKSPARLWRSTVATLLYVIMMGYFVFASI